MPKLVLRVGVGVKSYPDRPFKRQAEDVVASNDVRVSGSYFELKPWCEEQGIDDFAFVSQLDVTEFDDGSLVAYFTRYELMSDEEHAAAQAERDGNVSKLQVYCDEDPLVHTYVEHHPVTSIQTLLDQFVPECTIIEKEPV